MESRIKVKDWPFLGQGQFLRIIRENIDHIGTDTVGLLDLLVKACEISFNYFFSQWNRT